jgi:hypothetical protein
VARKDNGHPEFGCTFTFTHSNFRWTLGDGFVREDTNENLTFTLEEAGERHTAGFDLVVSDPAAVEELKAEVTKVELVAAGGIATAIADAEDSERPVSRRLWPALLRRRFALE